jgi:SAM-dependent methyltransferase
MSTSFRSTRAYIRYRWPTYVGLYGVCVAALLALGAGLVTGWLALVPLALAALLVAAYFLVSTIWAAHIAYDRSDPLAILYTMSQTRPEDDIANIELGTRTTSIWLARHLTTGTVAAIDVYNPESNTSTPLRRARLSAAHPPSDPRLAWIDGGTSLLPLADRSVACVFLNEVLSEYWEDSERERLLREIHRVLEPDGCVLLTEPVRTQTSLLLWLPRAYDAATVDQWRRLLTRCGFEIRREQDIEGLLVCLRGDKTLPTLARQLTLGLEYL